MDPFDYQLCIWYSFYSPGALGDIMKCGYLRIIEMNHNA